jgi:mannitol/fructose-specific phosphotransferase system IIA component (Ntr-type)
MDLLTLVRRRLIVPQLVAHDKHIAIHELVDFLVTEQEIPLASRDVVLKAVLNREAEKPTGLGDGLSLPHGVVDLLEKEVAVLGLSDRGIDFGAIDGRPAHIIILLVTPRYLAHRHPTNVRSIVMTLCQPAFRKELSACRTIDDVIDFLTEDEELA